MKAIYLGSVLVAICGGIIAGYAWKGVELRSVSHWGICCADEGSVYCPPTGDNSAIYHSDYNGWREYKREWPELTVGWSED